MATVIKIDTRAFERDFEAITKVLTDKDSTLRPVAIELVEMMATRIHDDGLASDGSLIGSYTEGYLALREGRGLGSDKKVILVLSRKLYNSWSAFPTDNGWAVGFVDDAATDGVTSRKKIEYAEQHFGKKIIDPTEEELRFAADKLLEIVNELLSPYANA